jgi:dienelactone hydrolase
LKRSLTMLAALALLTLTHEADAKLITQAVEYKAGDTVCEGVIAYDDAATAKRPGVLLAHDWMGVTDHQKLQVAKLAALGYVALAADVYGKGVRPADAQSAGATAGALYKDRGLMRSRMRAALDWLAAQPQVDATHLAVTGYCFGGACALELARSGAPLRAVVTFHGTLATPTPQDAKNIKAKVLVLHGADDPYVKQEDVKAFMDEMRAAGVDWQVVQYSGAVHSFTDPRAGTDNNKGAAYNAAADRRSWRAMSDFLEETLK